MMIKNFFLALIIFISLTNSISTSATSSYAAPIPTISKTYTEGFYKFNNTTDVNIGVTLLTNIHTKIMILDEEMNIQFISLMPYNSKFYLRNISPKSIIAIIGKGEVALSFE
ncbi:hypothetical protein PMY56_15955 [Clostridium tertium]|uniref:hypothetical protein n=2 Tax=Clostridium tertium TaxID=1559 RepID=UPI00232D5209|nr:hypothetical protein [Clostridium tertium]MDB1923481.1 hypothetical protein [Clostridium tertium]MDB1927628.1 hypothetical protein [Clostridium tertium]MDB1931254.1 hypothetical protein [Clostridium tertium]